MRRVRLDGSFAGWRDAARKLLQDEAEPQSVFWTEEEDSLDGLFPMVDSAHILAPSAKSPASVPKAFLDVAQHVVCHQDPARWSLLYRILYRFAHGEKHLLAVESDPDVNLLLLMDKAVRRDMHKMRAFVRFRQAGENYIAWHRPDHHIVEINAPFFVRRFGAMHWAILTPDRSAYWDTQQLRFGPGVPRSEAPSSDDLEALWLTYYASIFNPARVKVKAMKAEMPVRHWATMPETALVPELLLRAQERVIDMAAKQPTSAQPFVPKTEDLTILRTAASSCEGCGLFLHATQTVFGEGPPHAKILFVGEQPGDQEDLAGTPFVGPAGQIFNRALQEAGIDRSETYVTNAVKHFKFVERGKRRIHDKPSGTEIAACRPWLEAEVRSVGPELLVCLGATAGQSVFGRVVKVGAERGRVVPHHWVKSAFLTIHPSFLLRITDPVQKQEEYSSFVQDLKKIKGAL